MSLAGTAILSKHEPISVDMTLPGHPNLTSIKGRIISLEFEKFFLIGTYVVNAGQDLKVPFPFVFLVNGHIFLTNTESPY